MTTEQSSDIANNLISDSVLKLDVDLVGICNLAQWKGTKLEETALRLLPEASSVVVFAMEIYPEILDLSSPERVTGAASTSDLLARNADYLNGRLTKAAYDTVKASHKSGLKALPLPAAGCPYDTRFMEAVFSYKHAGQAAGLGKFGWNSLLITPDFGPRVRLSCCLTGASLQSTAREMTVQCESCCLCINGCPAGALSNPQSGEAYAINKFACSSYRSASGGCAECMRLCPTGA